MSTAPTPGDLTVPGAIRRVPSALIHERATPHQRRERVAEDCCFGRPTALSPLAMPCATVGLSCSADSVVAMATHDVSLNITKPIPVGNVDIEIPVRRNGRAFGKVKISKGAIDWMPANKSKTAYYLAWGEFAKFMAEHGRQV
jgi:hypothetical protein